MLSSLRHFKIRHLRELAYAGAATFLIAVFPHFPFAFAFVLHSSDLHMNERNKAAQRKLKVP